MVLLCDPNPALGRAFSFDLASMIGSRDRQLTNGECCSVRSPRPFDRTPQQCSRCAVSTGIPRIEIEEFKFLLLKGLLPIDFSSNGEM